MDEDQMKDIYIKQRNKAIHQLESASLVLFHGFSKTRTARKDPSLEEKKKGVERRISS